MPKAASIHRVSDDVLDGDLSGHIAGTAECRRLRRRRIRWVARAEDGATDLPEPSLPLSSRAIACLLDRMPGGRESHRSGVLAEEFGVMAISPAKLLKLAAGRSKAELLSMRGIGIGTVAEIERWLDAHGQRFRSDPDGLTAALGKAIEHLEAVLESHSDEALLQAFLALPALKKALRAAPGRQTHVRRIRRAVAFDPSESRSAGKRR